MRAEVTPEHASPILRRDLQHLMRDMLTCLLCAAQPVDRLACARDMALFAIAFHTGSHGSDLAKLLPDQVLRLPSSQGLELNFQFTKILRDGAAHASLLAPNKGMPKTCAIAPMILDGTCPRVTFPLKCQATEDRIPKRLVGRLSAKAMIARFK